MIAALKRALALIAVTGMITACGIAASYRQADEKTIRDFAGDSDYRKTVGVMALANATMFTSGQATAPFMQSFMASMTEAAADARLILPGTPDAPPFLSEPPRLATGDVDVFAMTAMARQKGINVVVRPLLMNLRVRKRLAGFWFFKDERYDLQIQAAAEVFDTITGSRIDLHILTETVEIDEQLAGLIQAGREVQVAEMGEVVAEMGEIIGERMGEAIEESNWATSIISAENGTVTIPAGSTAGIEPGDRFSVLDASVTLTGLRGQRYIVPGPKIGEITIQQTTPESASATVPAESTVPAGSIVVPGI